VAAQLAPLAVGTETDGSITCPASLNGVAGLKPTVGKIPTAGVVPISASQDSPGPMARTVADVALLYEVLAGASDVAVRIAAGASGVRAGVADDLRTGHPATDAIFEDALGALGACGVDVATVGYTPAPTDVHHSELTVMCCELHDDLGAYLTTRGGVGPATVAEVIAFEDAHRDVELAFFGHELFEQAAASGGRASSDYGPARAACVAWATSCLEVALADRDVLVAPAWGPAWKSDLVLGDADAPASGITTAPSILGWPIATVPMGAVDGLPVGLSLVGRPGAEPMLLAVAAAFERELGLVAAGALVPGFAGPRRG